MCTGRPPFRAERRVAVLRRVCDDDAAGRSARSTRTIPDWLAAIIERLHAKDPADRFQSAAEVADLLGRHLARLQDPSLPPVEHAWDPPAVPPRREVARSWRAGLRARGGSTVPVLLLAVAAGSRGGDPVGHAGPGPRRRGAGRPTRPRPAQGGGNTACDFRDGRYDYRWLHLEPNGPLTSLAKPDRRGLRIAIPPKTECRGVGAFTMFGIRGDFEVTASFEILKADRPRRAAASAPSCTSARSTGGATTSRSPGWLRTADGRAPDPGRLGREVNGRSDITATSRRPTSKAGRFRIIRVGCDGPLLRRPKRDDFRKDSDAFREVARHEFGTKDIDTVRFMGQFNDSDAAPGRHLEGPQDPGRGAPRPGRRRCDSRPTWSSWWAPLAGLAAVAALGGRGSGGAAPAGPGTSLSLKARIR